MENNIDIVVDTTEALKASSKGRYFHNIAKICQTKHGWNEDTTKAILDEAIKQSRIHTTTVIIKYRIESLKVRPYVSKMTAKQTPLKQTCYP